MSSVRSLLRSCLTASAIRATESIGQSGLKIRTAAKSAANVGDGISWTDLDAGTEIFTFVPEISSINGITPRTISVVDSGTSYPKPPNGIHCGRASLGRPFGRVAPNHSLEMHFASGIALCSTRFFFDFRLAPQRSSTARCSTGLKSSKVASRASLTAAARSIRFRPRNLPTVRSFCLSRTKNTAHSRPGLFSACCLQGSIRRS